MLLEVRDLAKSFPIRHGLRRERLQALRGVSFDLARGEVLGVVGESGCGKTTLGRCVAGAQPASAGSVCLDGRPVFGPGAWHRRDRARRLQMVFQDPFSSLNPRLTVGGAVAEVIRVHRLRPPALVRGRVLELLDMVGLSAEAASRLPHEFSGGQRQRISIARALAAEPALIVADEPVSALDVSIQAQVLTLLAELRARLGLAYLFVSHDLHVVRHISDRVAVLYLGGVVELAPTASLFDRPRHPYTQALLSAVPNPDPEMRSTTTALQGEAPDPTHPPSGCGFRTRCPIAIALCAEQPPELRVLDGVHAVRCHRA